MKDKFNRKKYYYWQKILGEDILEYCIDSSTKIEQYMSDESYNEYKSCSEVVVTYNLTPHTHCIEISDIEREIYFPEFYFYILNYSVCKLEKSLVGKEQYWDRQIFNDFALHLAKQLHSICIRTLIVKMHEYKNKELLLGDSIHDEYMYFRKEIISKIEFVNETFDEYPVLLSCIKDKIEYLTSYYVEIIDNFKNDKDAIASELCDGKKAERICGIQGDFSDVHNKGKQVLRIQLDNRKEILYKPHSMENEKIFSELLHWLSIRTEIEQLRYSFVTKEDYAWSSIVEYKECGNKEQLSTYYLRLGVQLFLAYILGTKDLHYDNIIAAGEYPVLIDLETLVNIHYNFDRKSVNDEMNFQLSQSVLYTGILPFVSWSYKGVGIDSSAINGGQGSQYPFKVPVIKNSNTSEMIIGYDYPIAKKKKNLATVSGKYVSPDLYTDEIIKGFQKAYTQVLLHLEEFSCLLEKIKETNNRYLVIDTQRYGMLLSSSYHPSLMKNGIERELFLNSIRKARNSNAICDSEIDSLLQGDIPYFYYKLNDTSLYNQNGVVDENYFAQKTSEIIEDRLKNINEKEMKKQCELINLSMTLSLKEQKHFVNETYKPSEINTEEKSDVSLKVTELKERILDHAVWNQEHNEVSWSVVHYSPYNRNWSIKPMGYYMYNGLAGMLLLFSVMKNTTDEEQICKIVQVLKDMLFKYTDKGLENLDSLQSKNTGAYDGESSIIYVYLALFKLTGKEDYLIYAEKHARILKELVAADANYDLLSGNAGAAIIAVKLYEVTEKKEYLDLAEQAIHSLRKSAVKMKNGIGWITEENMPPLAGMAHGNAGVLMAVLSVWNATQKTEYMQLAIEIWEYEESLYNYEMNNWRDMRVDEEASKHTDTIAWCHGAAGILLSRSVICRELDAGELKSKVEQDYDRALRKMQEFYTRDSWCLCHGNLGNEWIYDIAKEGVEDRNRSYDITLMPQEKNNPGLMNGYGGILYYLLKVQGDEVPNVMALEI